MTSEQEWLAELKVGDEVAVVWKHDNHVRIAKVKDAREGFVDVLSGTYSTEDGKTTMSGLCLPHIEYPSHNHRRHARFLQMQSAFQDINYRTLTADQLERILAIAGVP